MSFGAWAYFILFILGLAALCISYWKARSFRLIILYFTVVGITLLFDYFVYVLGKAYKYYPGILEGKYDTHLGAFVNGHLLPSFAVLFVTMRLRWYWSILLALSFTVIELLFTKWGLFEHNWWRPWYTLAGISIYFPVARLWWKNLEKKWIKFGTLLLSFYGIFIPLNFFLYAIVKTRTLHVEWIEHFKREALAFNTITALLFGVTIASLCIVHARKRWLYISFLGFIAYNFLLKYIGIVKAENMIVDSILSFLFFLLGVLFVRYSNVKIRDIVNDC